MFATRPIVLLFLILACLLAFLLGSACDLPKVAGTTDVAWMEKMNWELWVVYISRTTAKGCHMHPIHSLEGASEKLHSEPTACSLE